MNATEKEMKRYLDGSWFYLNPNTGAIECKVVALDFIGGFESHVYKNDKEKSRQGGHRSVEMMKVMRARGHHDWTDEQFQRLMYLRRNKISIRQCCIDLDLPHYVVRNRVRKMSL